MVPYEDALVHRPNRNLLSSSQLSWRSREGVLTRGNTQVRYNCPRGTIIRGKGEPLRRPPLTPSLSLSLSGILNTDPKKDDEED